MLPANNKRAGIAINGRISLPTSIVPRQIPLFTRKAIVEFPQSQETADALGEVEADDRHLYYIKGDSHGHFTRASEWLSTHIAEEVGITTPAPAVIERLDHSVVFGSRRIAGVSDLMTTYTFLMSATISNTSKQVVGLKEVLSSIYALDLFLYNDDRHLGNYLSVPDGDIRRLYAFDFSRALFWKWPWDGFPTKDDKTRVCGQLLQQLHGFDHAAADATLDRLGALDDSTIQSFMGRMPSDWLSPDRRADFAAWWSDGAKMSRIDNLREGFSNGTLL
ncbi:hypothetical protein NKW54_15625 [Acetobacter cerevisiae]|uniref:HipA-like kinase domain-containing protein n=1 Tax=Acetobacter cerevisiae TaxID=178900 RepID=A0ABT1EY10_9PROT|nr:HipA family kinase [Acetobacter cerevisiae]MCP1247340.1 hypothetical protein [Acetobacter cerevisiae]MCP1256889.1 hypothetical protein [Acetobacter cerevisiae]